MTGVENDDYVLRWPPEMLKLEISRELNHRNTREWVDERIELILEDAFTSRRPADDFMAASADPFGAPPTTLSARQRWAASFLRRIDSFPIVGSRKPYYSERKSGRPNGEIPLASAMHEFKRLVAELDARGYFEEAFGKDCVDAPADVEPGEVISARLGRGAPWPIDTNRLESDHELFFDLIEVLHDLVSAPRKRHLHSYGGCGWHHEDFSRARGQTVYRWRANLILGRTSSSLRLSEDGEDRGRLVEIGDQSMSQLVDRMVNSETDTTAGVVAHALVLFRARGADPHDKRSACRALAGVLEERRALLKDRLYRKDEGSLFDIANNFSIRHQNAQQQGDYDPAFLEWVFWWYLATIDLTNRLLQRPGPDTPKEGAG